MRVPALLVAALLSMPAGFRVDWPRDECRKIEEFDFEHPRGEMSDEHLQR